MLFLNLKLPATSTEEDCSLSCIYRSLSNS